MGEGRRWLAEALAASEGCPAGHAREGLLRRRLRGARRGRLRAGQGGVRAQPASSRRRSATAAPKRPRWRSSRWLAMSAGQLRARPPSSPGRALELATEIGRQAHRLRRAQHARGDRRRERATTTRRSGSSSAALALRRELGDKRLIANSLLSLGRAELTRGDDERATALLEEGLALARQVRDTWSISVAVANLGRVQLRTNGDPTRAHALLVEGLKLAQRPQRQARRRRVPPGARGRERDRGPGPRGGPSLRCAPSCCSRPRAPRSRRPRRRSATSS